MAFFDSSVGIHLCATGGGPGDTQGDVILLIVASEARDSAE
jgi:hypothetical protein